MPTARLLSPGPRVDIIEGQRVLVMEVVVDLGRRIPELHRWARMNDLNPKGAGDRWILSENGYGHTVLRVLPGFVYDGSSEPWWLYPLFGPRERRECAGLFHDELFRKQAPREPSDFVYWIIARSGKQHVGKAVGWTLWAGLRLFGGFSYRRRGRELVT